MLKKTILIFLLFFSTLIHATSLKDRLIHGQVGDYFVAKHGKMISILRVASMNDQKIILEEISAPTSAVKEKNWQNWINQKAQGHTSWVMYEIDLNTNELIECFSFTRNAFLQPKDEHFLLTLMKNPLKPVSDENRKKIGSPPRVGEPDFRAIWQPPKIVNGKKMPREKFLVLEAKWPIDHTELSGKTIHLYFDPDKEFFFPFWVEILSDHFILPLKVIDAGHDLRSCRKSIPRRSLQFLTMPKKTKQGIKFHLLCPKYYQHIQLFAINHTDKRKEIIEIPIELIYRKGEKIECIAQNKDLLNLLKKNHSYSWIIKPKGSELISELQEPFYFD